MEGGELLRALAGELELALDLLGGKLGEILIDDIADVLQVDGEGDDLHGPVALALVEAAARQLGDVELDGLVELVDHVVHARHLAHQRPVVGHQRFHDLPQHDLDRISHAQGLAGGVRQGQRGRVERGFVEDRGVRQDRPRPCVPETASPAAGLGGPAGRRRRGQAGH